MAYRVWKTFVVTGCLLAGTFALGHAVPIQPMDLSKIAPSDAGVVSFWGLPYPYGYNYRGNTCMKRVRVQTEAGWRWDRVWVCEQPVPSPGGVYWPFYR